MKIPNKKSTALKKQYWQQLWQHYTDEYREVFIQCWNTETAEMAELVHRSKKVRKEGLVHYFRVELSGENRRFLQEQSFEKEQLKWFMVRFIREDGSEGIEVRDYGTETFFNQLSSDEANELLRQFEEDELDAEFIKDEGD